MSQTPDWVTRPPADTATALYGIGGRENPDSAQKAALAEIAGKLGTVVRAETSITTRGSDGRSSEALDEIINASVSRTEFSDFQVLQRAVEGNRHWVLVKVDKQKMSQRLVSKRQTLEKELEGDFGNFAGRSSLAQIRRVPQLQQKLEQSGQLAFTLKGLDPAYDLEAAQSKQLQRERLLEKARDSARVRIENDNNTRVFANRLKGLFGEALLTLDQTGGRKGKSVIVVNSDATYDVIFGDQLVKLLVDIQALDSTGAVVASSNHVVSGASPTSRQNALEQANNKLADEFEKQGLLDSLGL